MTTHTIRAQQSQTHTGTLPPGARSINNNDNNKWSTCERIIMILFAMYFIINVVALIYIGIAVLRSSDGLQSLDTTQKINTVEEAYTRDGVALRSGDLVKMERRLMGVTIYHFGIVTKILSSEKFVILHNTGWEHGVQVDTFRSKRVSLVERGRRAIGLEEAQRMKAEYAEKQYDLCSFNCEHFARGVHSGAPSSRQTDHWTTSGCALRKASVHVALKLLQYEAMYSNKHLRNEMLESSANIARWTKESITSLSSR